MASSDTKHSSETNGLEGSAREEHGGAVPKDKTKAHKNWKSRMRQDADFRRKVLRSTWVSLAFFALGLRGAVTGPAFMDLQLITDTNVQQASVFFTASSAGYLSGSLLSGFVYDFLSKSLLLVVSLVGTAVLTAATPFCRYYWLMVIVSFLAASFEGSVDTAGNADIIRTWGGKGQAALQAIHFTFAAGSVVGPLITEPFLAPVVHPDPHNYSADHPHLSLTVNQSTDRVEGIVNTSWMTTVDTGSSKTGPRGSTKLHPSDEFDWQAVENSTAAAYAVILMNKTPTVGTVDIDTRHGQNGRRAGAEAKVNESVWSFSNGTGNETVPAAPPPPPQTRVHYAFMIAALIFLLFALPFTAEYVLGHKRKKTSQRKTSKSRNGQKSAESGKSTKMELSRWMYVGMLLWACAFHMLYTTAEVTFGSFLTYYVVNQMEWTKSKGAVLTSVFWISFAVSRFVCIFLAKALSSVQMLMSCFSLLLLSFVGFLLSSVWQLHWGVWLCTAMGGAAMSAVFPCSLSWIDEELLPVTGRVVSAIVFSASFGLVVNPLVLGHLMEHQGAIWLAYILLGEAVLCVLTFVLLLLFSRLYLQRTYPLPVSGDDLSLQVPPDGALPECSQRFLEPDREGQEETV